MMCTVRRDFCYYLLNSATFSGVVLSVRVLKAEGGEHNMRVTAPGNIVSREFRIARIIEKAADLQKLLNFQVHNGKEL